MAIAINSTIKIITEQLDLPNIHLIVYTDLYSLYKCLIKLRTTQEKRLIIDIIVLRQSYERQELFKVRWINGQDNPANAIIKSSPNKALETFIKTNSLTVRVKGQVKRDQITFILLYKDLPVSRYIRMYAISKAVQRAVCRAVCLRDQRRT